VAGPISVATCALLALTFLGRSGHAADACTAAYESAQERRLDADLLGARQQLLQCAAAPCAAFIQRDCAQWLAEVEAALPTIVVVAHDAAKHDLTEVRVGSDGQLLVTALDARPLSLNPGKHRLTFEAAGFAVQTVDIFLPQGQKNRVVEVTFVPVESQPQAAKSPPARTKVPVSVYLAGGLAVLGVSGFTAFALAGKSAEDTVRQAQCAKTHSCTDAQLADPRRKYLLADVSLLVGILSGAATAFFWFRQPDEPGGSTRQLTLSVDRGSLLAVYAIRY
jgi:hypothetical protein